MSDFSSYICFEKKKNWKFEVEADQYALVVKEKECCIAKMFYEF